MSGWRRLSARPLLSSISGVNRISPRVPTHVFESEASHSLASNRQHYHTTLRWRKELIRTYINDLARARRRFTTSSTQRHGHLDPPKPGEESVYTCLRTIELLTVLTVLPAQTPCDLYRQRWRQAHFRSRKRGQPSRCCTGP